MTIKEAHTKASQQILDGRKRFAADKSSAMLEFAGVFRDSRNAKSLTLNDLCEVTGVSYPYLNAIENAKAFPSKEIIERIAPCL